MPARMRLEPDNDLVEGLHEWRPVQEIVRLTFKALHDVVRAQAEAIRNLEKALGAKVSRPEHAATLAEKVSISELSHTFDDLSKIIDAKLDAADAAGVLESKADRSATEAALQSKADHADVQRCLDAKADADELHRLFDELEARREASEARLLSAIDARADELEASLMARLGASESSAAAVEKMMESFRAELVEALATRPTKAAVAVELRKKMSRGDVEAIIATQMEGMASSLSLKADAAATASALSTKATRQDLEEMRADRATRADLTAAALELEAQISNARAEAAAATEDARALCARLERESAAAISDLKAGLASKASVSDVQTRPTGPEVEALVARRPDRTELGEAMEALATRVHSDARRMTGEARAELEEKQIALRTELSSELSALGRAVRERPEWPEIEAALSRRPERGEMEAALATRASADDLHVLLNKKASSDDACRARDAAQHAAEEARRAAEGVSRALSLNEETRRELRDSIAGIKAALAESLQPIEESLASKPGAETITAALRHAEKAAEAMGLISSKADIDDVNASLVQVNRELSLRPTLSELNRVVSEQSLLMESLCAEHLLGRWLWKSGKTKGLPGGAARPGGGAVPWNVQNVNTNPANFMWEKDRASIMCVAPGLYEVTFGFFSRKKPQVQLLVNGEPVLSSVNSASYAVHHSSGRLAPVGPHSAGNVTGLTLVDFVALPPNAKVACTYLGEEGAEGFLGLRKM